MSINIISTGMIIIAINIASTDRTTMSVNTFKRLQSKQNNM